MQQKSELWEDKGGEMFHSLGTDYLSAFLHQSFLDFGIGDVERIRRVA